MIELITELLNEPWFQILISFIPGVILSVIFMLLPVYVLSKPKPKYVSRTKEITQFHSKLDEFEVVYKYRGKKINCLSETILYIWNARNKSIRKSDLLKATPITIKIPKSITLYRVDYIATQDIDKSLEIHQNDKGDYVLSFDAMQKHDGVCFKILHSGDAKSKIVMEGKLDGRIKVKKGTTMFDADRNRPLIIFNNAITRILIPFFIFISSSTLGIHSLINRYGLRQMLNPAFGTGPMQLENQFQTLMTLSVSLLFLALYLFYNALTCLPNEIAFLTYRKEQQKNLYIFNNARAKSKQTDAGIKTGALDI